MPRDYIPAEVERRVRKAARTGAATASALNGWSWLAWRLSTSFLSPRVAIARNRTSG